MPSDNGPWAPFQPTTKDPWDLPKVAHLHRRAGFGAARAELARDVKDGPAASVDRLLKPRPLNDDEKQVLDSLITLTWEQRVTAWAIANKLSDRRLAKEIHCSHPTASDRKNALLRQLAADWNARGWTPDDFDLEHARSLIRRIID